MCKLTHRAVLSIAKKAKRVIQKAQGKQFVHFLHIGKTGGTAVKHALKQYSTYGHFVILLHRHSVTLRDIAKGESVFFFLRDPISRFVSGFYSRQRQGQPRFYVPWGRDEKNAFKYFDTPNHLAITLSSTNAEERVRAEKAMKSIEHVRSSYWDWFESEKYFKSRLSDIFFIGFQEHLNKHFEILKSKLSLPDSVELPKDDIQAHRNPKNLNKFLEDDAIENLSHWYNEEYNFIRIATEIVEHRNLGSSKIAAPQDAATWSLHDL